MDGLAVNGDAPSSVDWFRLLWDLVQRGLTVAEIGRKTGISESTLYGYMKGSHPVHWRGEALIVLWCRVLAKQREDVPTCEVYFGPRIVQSSADRSTSGDCGRALAEAWR